LFFYLIANSVICSRKKPSIFFVTKWINKAEKNKTKIIMPESEAKIAKILFRFYSDILEQEMEETIWAIFIW